MSRSVWTQDNIVNSPFNDVVIPNVTVPQYIWRNINNWADRMALECGVTNRSFTYSQVYEYSRNFATNLRTRLQIKDGDVVGIMMPNTLEYPIAVMGAMEAGAIITTINSMYTPNEVYRQIVLLKPKLIISTVELCSVVQEAIIMTNIKTAIIITRTSEIKLPFGTTSLEELINNDNKLDKNILNDVVSKPDDVVFLQYSSGTTGLPKGVELSHKNVVANFVQRSAEGIKYFNETTYQNQDSVMAILPFSHNYGLSSVLLHKLACGAKIVILPKFQPSTFLNALKNCKINLVYAVPALVLFLGSSPEVKKEHLASVDRLVCGAAPITKSSIRSFLEKCQPALKFIHLYGLTEASIVSCAVPGSHDHTTVGFALPNSQLRVVASNGQNLGPNKVGELHIRGPHVMKGYNDNPKATKAAFTDDRWLKSGDLASINSDGIVTIVDRIKDLIKVKGYQVAPAELEDILKEHSDILETAVIGIHDDKKGEVPKAFIVLKEGHEATPANIKEFVNKFVADYKQISEVEFLDALPKNASGKILRRVLRDRKIV